MRHDRVRYPEEREPLLLCGMLPEHRHFLLSRGAIDSRLRCLNHFNAGMQNSASHGFFIVLYMHRWQRLDFPVHV